VSGAERRASLQRLGASRHLAALPASVRTALANGANRRAHAPHLGASLPSAVRYAVQRGSPRWLWAALVLTPLASAVHRAVWSTTLRRLGARVKGAVLGYPMGLAKACVAP